MKPYRGVWPKLGEGAWVAPGAAVVGDVELGERANVWFGCAIRGDEQPVRIGDRSNVQDACVIHVAADDGPTMIGHDVTIGHGCVVHACTLEDECLVGMGSIVLDGAVVGRGAMLGAGSLLAPGKRVGPGELWLGNPARRVRDVSEAERETWLRHAREYVERADRYRRGR